MGVGAEIIAAVDLYRFFHTRREETRALRGVNLSIQAGEFVALVGPSGSGKSTLLACLAGLDVPDGGQVRLLGELIARLSEAEKSRRRRQNIGVLMQSGNLFAGLSAEENVSVPLILTDPADRNRAAQMLADVGLIERRAALPSQLSGGEAARAGLAVALAAGPRLLLADEPTAEVDGDTESDLIRLIAKHCAAGAAAIVATHSASVAGAADRVIHLLDGQVTDAVAH